MKVPAFLLLGSLFRGSLAFYPTSRGLAIGKGLIGSGLVSRRTFAAASSFPTMLFGGAFKKKSIDYGSLQGAAGEAGKAALAGKILKTTEAGHSVATFAGGCFWGLELRFQRVPGVVDTSVGYTQGNTDQPTYEETCAGNSGHTEAVQVFYDPKEVSYEELLNVFFERVDPTTVNGQGNDRGTQYRTGVYPHTDEQMEVAKKVFAAVAPKYSRPIACELKTAMIYWPAEQYHQHYLSNGGRGGRPQSAEKGATETIRCYG